METTKKRLKNLSDKKLINVVKNYRQYGYDESIRAEAIKILEERGVDQEELKLTGNFNNTTFENSQETYHQFRKNSKIAFAFYCVMFITSFLNLAFARTPDILNIIFILLSWISAIFFLVFLIRSFQNQNLFYKTIRKEHKADGILLYIIMGMPFYALFYFHFINKMKEEMNLIN